MLVDELGTSSNIKSKQTRKSIQSALKSAQQLMKTYKTVPENGLAIFSGLEQSCF
jgi:peptide chain release factor subunit 1